MVTTTPTVPLPLSGGSMVRALAARVTSEVEGTGDDMIANHKLWRTPPRTRGLALTAFLERTIG